MSEEKSDPWVSGVHCTSESRWRVLRQGRVTAGRSVIRETMSPNGVEDIGSKRCIRDFDNLFTVFHPYYAEVQSLNFLCNSLLSHLFSFNWKYIWSFEDFFLMVKRAEEYINSLAKNNVFHESDCMKSRSIIKNVLILEGSWLH